MGDRVVRLLVHLWRGERGWLVAEAPEVPGAVSQGRTEEEALRNIQEAAEGILETRLEWVLKEQTDPSGRPAQLFETYGHPRAAPPGVSERLIEVNLDAIAHRLRGSGRASL